ncbi:hypothetical protein WG909_07765 [Peptostreptococcaceae bacterium AGR-M142]
MENLKRGFSDYKKDRDHDKKNDEECIDDIEQISKKARVIGNQDTKKILSKEMDNDEGKIKNKKIKKKLDEKKKKKEGKEERTAFPNAVKTAFTKDKLMTKLGLGKREIHLRHFVMGSWFRSLPEIVSKQKKEENTDVKTEVIKPEKEFNMEKQLKDLIPRLNKFAGGKKYKIEEDLIQNTRILSEILHNLEPNLNAGEGFENSFIGVYSNKFTELAFKIDDEKTVYKSTDIDKLLEERIISSTQTKFNKDDWLKDTNFKEIFKLIINIYKSEESLGIDNDDEISSHIIANALHYFAYQLGMDFMKHEEGIGKNFKDKNEPIKILQSLFVGVGEQLYYMVKKAHKEPISEDDIKSLFEELEKLTIGLESMK